MTEYDYSPDAIERHMAKQAAIAHWVDKTEQHEPTNPFFPLPGEHPPHSDFYSQSPPQTPPPQIQQPAHGYPYSHQYQYPYQTMPQYQPNQLYYPSHPQPAFYATPQGVISPTYSSMYVSPASRSHHSHRSSSRHSSGSRSLRRSSTSTGIPLQSMVLGSKSYSSPPSQSGQYFISPTTSPNGGPYVMQVGHQQQLMQPLGFAQPAYPHPAGYTTMHSSGSTPAGSSYSSSYYSLPQTMAQMTIGTSRGRSKSRSKSVSYSHSHSSSHRSGRSKSRSGSYSNAHHVQATQPQPSQTPYGMAYGAHSTPYLQPTANQPVVVPLNGGGYVIVPTAGQSVSVEPQPYQYPQYNSRVGGFDSDSERGGGASFFGSLNLGRRSKKSRRHSRTGSY